MSCLLHRSFFFFFFFNDTATTEIYTLSLHDALPIWMTLAFLTAASISSHCATFSARGFSQRICLPALAAAMAISARSEEHTSELQSQSNLVCRLLLEKKKNNTYQYMTFSYQIWTLRI